MENDKFISYSWYIALYNVLSRNWYDAWLLEFFISLHNSHQSEDDFEPIKPELLDQLNQSIANHLHIMQTVFKLIWDIEKDWGLNPIHVIPHLQGQLPSNLDYPINKYSILLFGGFNRLDGLFITPDIYEKNLKNMRNGKSLNHLLEAKIVDFFVSNHVNIEKTLSANGHWGIFQEIGLHLITYITMPSNDNIDNILTNVAYLDDRDLLKLKRNICIMAYDSISFDDELRIRKFIIESLGQNVAKWRQEWKVKVD